MKFAPVETYRYVGLGSVAFVDCRTIHRAFGITDIISIEGTNAPLVQTRFERNKPFRCVDLRFGMTWDILPTIDFDQPSIVWMDYDDQIRRSMANDLATIARTLAAGSFLVITFATSFPSPGDERDLVLSELLNAFPEFLTDDFSAARFLGDGLARFGQLVFGELLAKELSDADAGRPEDERRKPEQVCFFRYRDGAWMCTVGWMVVTPASRPAFDAGAFDALPYVRSGKEPVIIRVPLITPLEIRELERHLPHNIDDEEISWIPAGDRSAFAANYRYLPNLAVVEPV